MLFSTLTLIFRFSIVLSQEPDYSQNGYGYFLCLIFILSWTIQMLITCLMYIYTLESNKGHTIYSGISPLYISSLMLCDFPICTGTFVADKLYRLFNFLHHKKWHYANGFPANMIIVNLIILIVCPNRILVSYYQNSIVFS